MGRRLRKTHNWIVAVKVLMVAHRLLRDGDAAIQHALASTRKKGMCVFSTYAFRDESHSNGWEFSAFVRAYGMYLDERSEYSSPSLSLPNSHQSSKDGSLYDQDHPYNSSSASPSGNDDDRSRGKQRRRRPVKKMRTSELLQKFPLFLRLLERILACRPVGAAKTNRLVLFALHPIVRESFLVYSDIRDGMSILLDAFFDLEELECLGAFDIYSKAAKQLEELTSFYGFCKSLGVCKTTEYPAVEKVSNEMLQTMSASLRLRLDSDRGNNRKAKAHEVKEELSCDSDHASKEAGSSRPPSSTRTRIMTSDPVCPRLEQEETPEVSSALINQSKDYPDLLDLDENPTQMTHKRGENPTSTIFPGTGTRIDTTWQTFSHGSTGNSSLNLCDFEKSGKQTADWELALESNSSLSRWTSADLASGFDLLHLDSLYDLGSNNQIRQAHEFGSRRSVSVMASDQPLQPDLLTFPASNAGSLNEQLHVVRDPFALSTNVPLIPCVLMSHPRQDQQPGIEEQQRWHEWQQHSQNFSYSVSPIDIVTNPFATPFQSPACTVPDSRMQSNYT
ncbi:hypothetical protein KP509_04G099900 [Ceratopteris richardii]|nr:hypothetical protein KP509_04G099900 [Ceratopteris richardii]